MERMMPRLPEAWQRFALGGLQAAIVLMAFVSLNPYFLWSTQKIWYATATVLIAASFAGCYRLLSPSRDQVLLCVAFSLFLVYLSLLPKVDGPPTRWFFLIPFVVAVLATGRQTLIRAFEWFYWLFALSLIPGMLVWLWLAAGMPLEMSQLALPAELTHNRVIKYLGVPGAIFLPADSTILPTGGVLFRLCAIYDEPGTVGTIAALCLAVTRFRIRNTRGALSLAAGIMSFSLAFAILAAIGFAATMIAERRWKLILVSSVTMVIGVVMLSGVAFDSGAPQIPPITVSSDPAESASGKDTQVKPDPKQFDIGRRISLRWFALTDNRATPEMRALFDKYADSSLGTILFGIASNASIIYGRESAVWFTILTDYGLVGFVWLFLLYLAPVVLLWRTGRLDFSVILFCVLYLMSFYQRPVIWLPAQMLIYFAGLCWVERAQRVSVRRTSTR